LLPKEKIMNRQKAIATFSLLVAIALLAGSAATSLSASPEPEPAPPPGPDTYLIDAPFSPESPGRTDIAVQGTLWRPERPRQFSLFQVKGWGIETKKKVAGDEWVHITVPLITRLENRLQKIGKVEFCAKSTNGTATKPVRIDLWANKAQFKSQVIAWPADNNYHCIAISFSPAIWKESLGISVLFHYANSADRITLYKAWVLLAD